MTHFPNLWLLCLTVTITHLCSADYTNGKHVLLDLKLDSNWTVAVTSCLSLLSKDCSNHLSISKENEQLILADQNLQDGSVLFYIRLTAIHELSQTVLKYTASFVKTSDIPIQYLTKIHHIAALLHSTNQKCILSQDFVIPDTVTQFYPADFRKQTSLRMCCGETLRFPYKPTSFSFEFTCNSHRVKRQFTNLNRPIFGSPSYNVDIFEEIDIGTQVIQITATDEDSGVAGEVRFSLQAQQDQRSLAIFSIDSITGWVITTARVDREVISTHFFTVKAVDQGLPSNEAQVSLTISVEDINDHSPLFEQSNYEKVVSEKQTVGVPILRLVADDGDSGSNQRITYSFIEPQTQFRIDSSSGDISLLEELDREQTSEYSFSVKAQDEAPNVADRLSSTVPVRIIVEDFNDNEPKFGEDSYTIVQREDLNVSQGPVVIGVINATDRDAGVNSQIIYSITYGDNGYFSINSSTGSLSVIQPLDHDTLTGDGFNLRVRAADRGIPSKYTTVNVKIVIEDVNDNPPRFKFADYRYQIQEDVTPGSPVGTIDALDADSLSNSQITYSLKYQNNLPFYINSDTAELKTNTTLDRETKSVYVLTVIAQDHGIPSLSSTVQVHITILDVNDNPPVFTEEIYYKMITEDHIVGKEVIAVLASDQDENDALTYTITAGDSSDEFIITKEQLYGVIRVNKPLSYDRRQFYSLTIRAVDLSSKYTDCTVRINVTDKNRHRPNFTLNEFEYSVSEDKGVSSPVGFVTALDSDAGANGRVSYQFIGHSVIPLPFTINSTTGEITVNSTLDRDNPETQHFQIDVLARDHGVESLESAPSVVKISILDVNDNPPVFNSPEYSASVSEQEEVDRLVVKIEATDADQPGTDNSRVTYTFTGGNDGNGSFFVTNIGEVRINKPLDRETTASYDLVAYALDSSPVNRLSTAVNIRVTVLDVNDNAPLFESSPVVRRILENKPEGTELSPIRATDADEGTNAEIRFSLVGGDTSKFILIDNEDGSLKLKTSPGTILDYESPEKSYTLEVQAASEHKITKTRVVVEILDINDNAPKLDNFTIIVNNYRENFPGGVIGRVPATDPDESDQGKLRYTITSGNEASFFRLNYTTGEISLNPGLDTDRPTNGTFKVQVRDDLNPVNATCILLYRLISDEMILNAVTLRLAGLTSSQFMSNLYKYLKEALSHILQLIPQNIYIIDIKDDVELLDSERILNVTFSAVDTENGEIKYLDKQFIQEQIYLRLDVLKTLSNVRVLPYDDTLCVQEPCRNYKRCTIMTQFQSAPSFISSASMLFRPIRSKLRSACVCPNGFVGMNDTYKCDTEINLCYSQPCKNGATCRQIESSFKCACATGFRGDLCEYDVLRGNYTVSNCPSEVCSGDDSYCTPLLSQGGLHCYRGTERCENNSTYTETCSLRSMKFTPQSYIMFPSLKTHHRFNVQLSFSTRKKDGLLLYNGRYSHHDDFLSLQLLNSTITASLSLGRQIYTVSVGSRYGVNDGDWHSIILNYADWTLTLSIDNCDIGLNLNNPQLSQHSCVSQLRLPIRNLCRNPPPIPPDTLLCSLQTTGPLLFGGLPDYLQISSLVSGEFVGCMRDIEVDFTKLDLESAVSKNKVESGCAYKRDFCQNSPCRNQGICRSAWDRFECSCKELFGGRDCSDSIDTSFTFWGLGSLRYSPNLPPIGNTWSNQIQLKTSIDNRLVMRIELSNQKHITFMIENGYLTYRYFDFYYVFSETKINDNRWHTFAVIYLKDRSRRGQINFQLDYPEIQMQRGLDNSLEGVSVSQILIGGDSQTSSSNPGYSGCIRDLRIADTKLTGPIMNSGVTRGCTPPERCSTSCPQASSICLPDWIESTCICEPGYAGPRCENICSSDFNPCTNRATCILNSTESKGYTCQCTPNYQGEYCELTVKQICPASWWGSPICGPCNCNTELNFDSSCDKKTGQCRCKEEFYQPASSRSCIDCSCYSTGSRSTSCDQTTGQCPCRDGVEARMCNICPNPFAEVTREGCKVLYSKCPRAFNSSIWWPRAEFGQTVFIACPDGSIGNASRLCSNSDIGWEKPNLDMCTSTKFNAMIKTLEDLEATRIVDNKTILVHPANTASYTFKVKQLTAILHEAVQDGIVYDRDLELSYRVIIQVLLREQKNQLFNLTNMNENSFLFNFINITSHLLDSSLAGLWEKLNQKFAAPIPTLINHMELYLENLVDHMTTKYIHGGLEPQQIISDNIIFALDTITQLNTTVPKYNNYLRDERSFDLLTNVYLPSDLFYSPTTSGGKSVAGYILYKHAALLNKQQDIYHSNVKSAQRGILAVNSPLFTLVVQHSNNKITEIKDSPISIELKFSDNEERTNPQCAYLDVGKLSTSGCQVVNANLRTVTCQCDHLSTFALIIDQQTDVVSLTVMSADMYVTISLSLVCLIFTFIVYICLRDLRSNYIYIQINLLICWIFSLIIYMLGLNQNQNEAGCTVVAVLLQFFVLSLFSWFTVNLLHIYRTLTDKRNVERDAMIVYIIIGYVLPGVVTALSIGLSPEDYPNENQLSCWLDIERPIVWSLAAPVILCFVISCGLICSNLVLMRRITETKRDFIIFRASVRVSLLLLPLTTGVWKFALLAANIQHTHNLVFGYLFSTFVLLTAIIILLTNVVCSERSRREIQRRFKQCQGHGELEDDSEFSDKRAGGFGKYRNNPAIEGGITQMTLAGDSGTSTTTSFTRSSTTGGDLLGYLRAANSSTSSDVHTNNSRHRHREYSMSDSDSEEDDIEVVNEKDIELASSHSSDEDEPLPPFKVSSPETRAQTRVRSPVKLDTPSPRNIHSTPVSQPNIPAPLPPYLVSSEPKKFTGPLSVSTQSSHGSTINDSTLRSSQYENPTAYSPETPPTNTPINLNPSPISPKKLNYSSNLLTHGRVYSPPVTGSEPSHSRSNSHASHSQSGSMERRRPPPPPLRTFKPAPTEEEAEKSSESSIGAPPPPEQFSSPPVRRTERKAFDDLNNETQV